MNSTIQEVAASHPRPEFASINAEGYGSMAWVWPLRDIGDGVVMEFAGGKLIKVIYR
jgi:hypothetical protein